MGLFFMLSLRIDAASWRLLYAKRTYNNLVPNDELGGTFVDDLWLAGIGAVLLFAYLLYALLKPEEF